MSVFRFRRTVSIVCSLSILCAFSVGEVRPVRAGIGPPPPRIFFTDIESGPVTGGEGGLGAFVFIHGEFFGSSRGASTVTIGGVEVARYVLWGSDNARARNLDLIVVQPGGNVTGGNVVVTVDGQSSNGVPFTVRDGSIYFVAPGDPGASDDNAGTFEAPFRTIYRPRQSLQPGDICYVREGRYDSFDPDYAGWDAVLLLDGTTSRAGTEGRPVAYVGYPGESAMIANPSARRGILFITDAGAMDYFVFANLVFSESQYALGLTGIGHRAIGNYFFEGGESYDGLLGINGESSNIEVLGNRLYRNGEASNKFRHGFYIGGYGTNRDIDFGWNEIDQQLGGRAIQMYGHLDGDLMDDVRIHDNFIRGSELNNIVIGGSDGTTNVIGTVRVWNNVIVGATDAGLRINDPTGTVIVEQNTIAGNDFAQFYVERGGLGRITLRNNILACDAGQAHVVLEQAEPGAMIADHNLYFNGGDAPAWDAAPIAGDPLFFDSAAGDFQIDADSPAADAGVVTGHESDFLGIARPQDGVYDVGAFEVAGLAPPPPDRPDLVGTWTKVKRKSGRKVKATIECRNGGQAASGPVEVQVLFSPTAGVDPDAVVLVTLDVPELQPQQSASIKVSGKRPADFGYIVAVIDSSAVVLESDESNNTVVRAIP